MCFSASNNSPLLVVSGDITMEELWWYSGTLMFAEVVRDVKSLLRSFKEVVDQGMNTISHWARI